MKRKMMIIRNKLKKKLSLLIILKGSIKMIKILRKIFWPILSKFNFIKMINLNALSFYVILNQIHKIIMILLFLKVLKIFMLNLSNS